MRNKEFSPEPKERTRIQRPVISQGGLLDGLSRIPLTRWRNRRTDTRTLSSVTELPIQTDPTLPSSPQEVVVDREGLEKHRFRIQPASMEGMKKIRNIFTEMKKNAPYLKGIGYFGSKITGAEHKGSDHDAIFFYNSDDFTDGMRGSDAQWDNLNYHFDAFLGKHGHLDEKTGKGGLRVDLSPQSTNDNLTYFAQNADLYMENPDHPDSSEIFAARSVQNIAFRFLLSVGEDVYKSRKVILDRLEGMEKGEAYFQFTMKSLAHFERNSQKVDLPEYDKLPKTIAEAREYFITK